MILVEVFYGEETLDADNLWKCDGCHNKVRAIKKTKLWTTPPIIVIQLKRFGDTGTTRDGRVIDYPLDNLDVRCVLSEDQIDGNLYPLYKLQSVINHTGTINFGHYYSYIKNEENDMWYIFDDHNVRRISTDIIVTSNAYILFYIRKDLLKK